MALSMRHANISDAKALAGVESLCFPKNEAATAEELKERVEAYPSHFILLFDGPSLISFIDGMATDEKDLTDDMYEKASLHNEKGAWQMIFGLNTIPSRRKEGHAGTLIRAFLAQAKEEGRKGVVLTCKEKLIHYYASFGFQNEGVSSSVHGGVIWYQMRVTF